MPSGNRVEKKIKQKIRRVWKEEHLPQHILAKRFELCEGEIHNILHSDMIRHGGAGLGLARQGKARHGKAKG